MNAVAEFQAASEANDPRRLAATLAPDAELISPLLRHAVIRGRTDLRLLFEAVYGSLSDVSWTGELVDGDRAVAVAHACIGPFKIEDAMLFELDSEGRIRRLRPHLRPWLASTWFALVVGAKLARHRGVITRATRRP